MRLKTGVVLTLATVAQTVGNTVLSKGMKGLALDEAGVSFTPRIILDALGNPLIWLGILCLLAFFALFSSALSWADLSFVLPVVSLGYVLNVASAAYFLEEAVSPTRWLGTLFITLGVILVARSGDRSGRDEPEGRERA